MSAEVLIYSATTVICHVLDFAERGLKMEITPETISQTVQQASEKLFEKMGITPEQLKQAIAQGKKEIDDYQTHQDYLGNKMQAVKQPKPTGGM